MCFVFSPYKNLSICDAREPQASSALPVLSLATCAQSWLACSLRFCRAAGESRPLQNAAAGVCWEPHQSRSRGCGTAGRSERLRFTVFLAEPTFLGTCSHPCGANGGACAALPARGCVPRWLLCHGSTWAFPRVCSRVGFLWLLFLE